MRFSLPGCCSLIPLVAVWAFVVPSAAHAIDQHPWAFHLVFVGCAPRNWDDAKSPPHLAPVKGEANAARLGTIGGPYRRGHWARATPAPAKLSSAGAGHSEYPRRASRPQGARTSGLWQHPIAHHCRRAIRVPRNTHGDSNDLQTRLEDFPAHAGQAGSSLHKVRKYRCGAYLKQRGAESRSLVLPRTDRAPPMRQVAGTVDELRSANLDGPDGFPGAEDGVRQSVKHTCADVVGSRKQI